MKNESKSDKISLEELINHMMDEKNHNPRDYCFRLITSKYPKESHQAFKFPGEFLNSLKTIAYTEDGRNLEMDCAQLILPKGDITCKSTINVEHQTTPLIKDKIGIIYDYKIYLIHKTNIPSNSIVITNIDPGKREIYYKTHDQIYKVKYIVITQKEITKYLSILENKIKNNKKLSKVEALYFTVIAIFIEGEKTKPTMEKIAKLFSKTNKIDTHLQLDIHQVLKKMIKYHFQKEDKNKCRELLTMISENIFQKNYEGLTYKEMTELMIKEKLEETNTALERSNQALKQKDKTIEQKDKTIEQKDKTIEQKDKEIEKLKQQLFNQKIDE